MTREQNGDSRIQYVKQERQTSDYKNLGVEPRRRKAIQAIADFSKGQLCRLQLHTLRGFARLRCENCVKSARREIVPITRTFFKVPKQRVRFSLRECTNAFEVIQRGLHKPCVERVKIQRDLDLRADDNIIEPQIAKAAWKLPHDEPISQFATGKLAESVP